MSHMRPFTYDVESTDLTDEEVSAFAHLVQFTCHRDFQHDLSTWLSKVARKLPSSVCDYTARQVQEMWRVESRL
jgi:tRNA U38,U39,U40 pseudouridine synthase TruA